MRRGRSIEFNARADCPYRVSGVDATRLLRVPADNRTGQGEDSLDKDGSSIPIVMCPGCKTPMRLVLLEPASSSLETGTFRCEQCGTNPKREFSRREKR